MESPREQIKRQIAEKKHSRVWRVDFLQGMGIPISEADSRIEILQPNDERVFPVLELTDEQLEILEAHRLAAK